ncbi:hypothetical protein D3C85_1867840 [compost metagenome]
MASTTGSAEMESPYSSQVPVPHTNIRYIDSEMLRVSRVRRVCSTCGKKLPVVSRAAR